MSNADKRSTVTDALDTLGTIIDEKAGRDAIHIAVEPVIAGTVLHPGQDISVEGGTAFAKEPFVGIVDPFIKDVLRPGERFWLMIYPRQITSLRHVWTHPAFDGGLIGETVIKAAESKKDASERWLRDFVDRSDCPGYEAVIAKALDNDSWSSEYLHFDGSDAHGEIPAEFWDHVEIVTGETIAPKDRASYFSCSC